MPGPLPGSLDPQSLPLPQFPSLGSAPWQGTSLVSVAMMVIAAASSSPRYASDLEQARPQTSGEEELQLQLALAMSREEAEKVRPTPRGPHRLPSLAQGPSSSQGQQRARVPGPSRVGAASWPGESTGCVVGVCRVAQRPATSLWC